MDRRAKVPGWQTSGSIGGPGQLGQFMGNTGCGREVPLSVPRAVARFCCVSPVRSWALEPHCLSLDSSLQQFPAL